MGLPNEILVPIFVYFNQYSEPGGTPFPDFDQPISSSAKLAGTSWTKLMLVCRRWRDVARATPMLWRTIVVGKKSSANWYKLCLARSALATIDVSFPYGPVTEEHLALFRTHWNRLRYLHLDQWTPLTDLIFHYALPAMQTLEICENGQRLDKRPRIIPDLDITAYRFPSLTVLSLTGFRTPTDPSIYARLRKLTLVTCPCSLTIPQFARLMADAPCLEHLDLEQFLDVLPKCNDKQKDTPPRPLPSLIYLRLSNHPISHTRRFLSLIVLPPTAFVHVDAIIDDAPDDADTMTSLLPANNAGAHLPGIKTINEAIVTLDCDEYSIVCWSDPSKPQIALHLFSTIEMPWHERCSDVMTDLVSIFGPTGTSLVDLHIDSYSNDASAEAWMTLFRAFPALERFSGSVSQAMFDGLRAASVREPLACPRLYEMNAETFWETLYEMRATLEAALDCIRYRAERGAWLKLLDIRLWEPLAEDLNAEESEVHDGYEELLIDNYLPRLRDLVSDVTYTREY